MCVNGQKSDQHICSSCAYRVYFSKDRLSLRWCMWLQNWTVMMKMWNMKMTMAITTGSTWMNLIPAARQQPVTAQHHLMVSLNLGCTTYKKVWRIGKMHTESPYLTVTSKFTQVVRLKQFSQVQRRPQLQDKLVGFYPPAFTLLVHSVGS